MKYKHALLQLKAIDLSKYPYEEIQALIHQLGKFGLIQFNFHRGKIIHRARPNIGMERFNNRVELQYKPKHLNLTYQRASIPNQTMFYGGIIPEELQPEELDMSRVIACAEAIPLLRDKFSSGIQKLTFSKWEVIEDINLIAICYNSDIKDYSSHSQELYKACQNWISNLTSDDKNKSKEITEFIASEFAKPEISRDYDYLISAIFSNITVNKGMGGIYYPSVRVGYQGYNVAICPCTTDKCLRLVTVAESTIFKNGDRTIVFDKTLAIIDDDKKPFSYFSIEHLNPKSKIQIKNELGLL